jgi:undecaprenyl-diphosphatase
MSIFEAIILGIVQGLTEFLPVSSSGHLELGKALLGLSGEDGAGLLFTIVVHAATALATVVVYRKDIAEIFRGLFKWSWNEESIFAAKIVVSMIPAAFVGLFFNEEIELLFEGQVLLVGGMLIITGLLLFLADRAKKTHRAVTFTDATVVGISQAIAILPGISRSGATIATSVLLGIDRDKAARFSFLMVVPLVLGKAILEAKDLAAQPEAIQASSFAPMIVAFMAAFVSGIIACRWMISLVKKARLKYFAYYCFAVGFLALVATWLQR